MDLACTQTAAKEGQRVSRAWCALTEIPPPHVEACARVALRPQCSLRAMERHAGADAGPNRAGTTLTRQYLMHATQSVSESLPVNARCLPARQSTHAVADVFLFLLPFCFPPPSSFSSPCPPPSSCLNSPHGVPFLWCVLCSPAFAGMAHRPPPFSCSFHVTFLILRAKVVPPIGG